MLKACDINDPLSTLTYFRQLPLEIRIDNFFTNCHISFKFLRDIIFCRANFRNIFTNLSIFLDFYMFLVLYHYYTRHQASNKAFSSSFHDSKFHFFGFFKISTFSSSFHRKCGKKHLKMILFSQVSLVSPGYA